MASDVRAIDTNVIVRYVVADDEDQFLAAQRVVETDEKFIGTTVILECEWVLRSAYRFSADQIVSRLTAFAGMPGVILEEPAEVAQALAWLAEGMDFADALHLARSRHCEVFVSFDRKLASRAKELGTIPVLHP